jgi:hypothetical protein
MKLLHCRQGAEVSKILMHRRNLSVLNRSHRKQSTRPQVAEPLCFVEVFGNGARGARVEYFRLFFESMFGELSVVDEGSVSRSR